MSRGDIAQQRTALICSHTWLFSLALDETQIPTISHLLLRPTLHVSPLSASLLCSIRSTPLRYFFANTWRALTVFLRHFRCTLSNVMTVRSLSSSSVWVADRTPYATSSWNSFEKFYVRSSLSGIILLILEIWSMKIAEESSNFLRNFFLSVCDSAQTSFSYWHDIDQSEVFSCCCLLLWHSTPVG